jgi:hypothetical protein
LDEIIFEQLARVIGELADNVLLAELLGVI